MIITEATISLDPTLVATVAMAGAGGPPGPEGPPGMGVPGNDGPAGKSAYEVALDNGFVGSPAAWLAWLVGPEGLSAYQLAVSGGFVGTEEEWLASLIGPQGPQGIQGPAGTPGTPGTPGTNGADGASAYEVAVANGFVGTQEEWLASLSSSASLTTLVYPAVSDAPGADLHDYDPSGWATKTLIRLTPTASIRLTGLAGGTDGRVAMLGNESTDRLILIEPQSAASVAANRITGTLPVFLVPGGTVTLVYDGTASRWVVSSSSHGHGRAFFDIWEDFIGGIGVMGSTTSGTGASGQNSTYLFNTTEKPLGAYQLDTGTTATGRAALGMASNAGLVPANGMALFLSRLATEQLSTGTDRFYIFSGFNDATTTNAVDGVYWQYKDDVSAAWQGACANNGSTTDTGAAGPTVDTTYVWLGVFVNATWTRATFFYSTNSATWVMAGELTTNLPPAARQTGILNAIRKSVGTTQCNLSTDLMAIRCDLARG